MILIEISSDVEAQLLAQRLRGEAIEVCLARIVAAGYIALEASGQLHATPKEG